MPKDDFFRVRIGKELKDDFFQACKLNQTKPSTVARNLLMNYVYANELDSVQTGNRLTQQQLAQLASYMETRLKDLQEDLFDS